MKRPKDPKMTPSPLTEAEQLAAADAFFDLFDEHRKICALCHREIKQGSEVRYHEHFYGPECYEKLRRRYDLRQIGQGTIKMVTCSVSGEPFIHNSSADSTCGSSVSCQFCVYSTRKIICKWCPLEEKTRRNKALAEKYGLPYKDPLEGV